MLLSPRPAHLSLPSSLPCFPLAPLILFAHWPLCSFQGFPPEVGGWGGGFLLQPLEHRVKMSILPKAIQSIDSMQSLSSYQRYFQRTRTNNFTICMEIQKTSNSQSNLEKEEWNWRNQSAWLQTILQSYCHQDSMALAQSRKYRSVEQNRKPSDKSMYLWTPYLWQRRQEYIMEKRQSLQQVVL